MRSIDMSTSDQLARLANRMSGTHSTLPPADPDTVTFRGNVVTVSDSDFRPMPYTDGPAAYVDGGDAATCRTPTLAASVNRVYSCAFRGGGVRLQAPGAAGRPVRRTGRRAAGRGRGPAG